jgi:hypothetical protein
MLQNIYFGYVHNSSYGPNKTGSGLVGTDKNKMVD